MISLPSHSLSLFVELPLLLCSQETRPPEKTKTAVAEAKVVAPSSPSAGGVGSIEEESSTKVDHTKYEIRDSSFVSKTEIGCLI